MVFTVIVTFKFLWVFVCWLVLLPFNPQLKTCNSERYSIWLEQAPSKFCGVAEDLDQTVSKIVTPRIHDIGTWLQEVFGCPQNCLLNGHLVCILSSHRGGEHIAFVPIMYPKVLFFFLDF